LAGSENEGRTTEQKEEVVKKRNSVKDKGPRLVAKYFLLS
jgi:hypothetical protein